MTPARERTAWRQGGDAVCLPPPNPVQRTWRLVLLGPPGVGKDTQVRLLSRAFGACQLSTGEVFRAARGTKAEPHSAMALAQACIVEHGELIANEIVLGLIRERSHCLHCRGGFMLNDFPRTLSQAQAIDGLLAAEHLQLDAVISYELPDAEILARNTGRRVCPQCHAVFHVTSRPPQTEGICDQCGAALGQRPDDRPEAVAVRLEAYAADTVPLAAHYRAQGLLIPISATGRPEEIFARTLDALAVLVLPPYVSRVSALLSSILAAAAPAHTPVP